VTLIELAVVLVLIGILAVVAAPRFLGTGTFDEYALRDQLTAAARYAQQRAMSDQRAGACYRLQVEAAQFGPQQSTDGGASFRYIGPLAVDAVTSENTVPDGVTVAPVSVYFGPLGDALDGCNGAVSATTIAIQGSVDIDLCVNEVGYAAPC
jgi:MSHA pilin protein MshC